MDCLKDFSIMSLYSDNPKWLSETVNIQDIKEGHLNLIVAPCGSGKTHFAMYELPKLVSKPYKMVYLIDTIIGKKQLLKYPNTTFYDETWRKAVCGEYSIYDDSGIVIMTYHHFGRLVERYTDFADQFELIVCDEIHNSVYFGYITTDEINYALLARKEIAKLINRNKNVKVVGITATPQTVVKFDCPINGISTDIKNLRHYRTTHNLPYQNILNLISDLDKDKTGIIYTTHVTQMKKIVELANSKGFNAAAVWSKSSKTHDMDEAQLKIWRHIVENEALPPEYNLIVINASCGTAINIRSHVDYMVINHTSSDIITQARGRVRNNLDVLFLLDKNIDDVITIEIPIAFIGLPLYQKEKELLCELFPIYDDRGRLKKWPTLKKHIQETGYTVTTHQDKNRISYDIINA